jgi:hypothetical protein
METGAFTIIGSGQSRIQPLDPADLAEAFIRWKCRSKNEEGGGLKV